MAGDPAGYWPMLKAYHRAREPLYRQIIADVLAGAGTQALILDAGCGDSFYSQLIAEALGPEVVIVALDLAFGPSAGRRVSAQVAHCQADMERPGLRPQSFDAVWLCRSLHSAGDPPRRIRRLARLVRPGGRLVVVENDFAHYPLLAWPADFERRVLSAHFQYLQSRCADGASLERYHSARHLPAWLEHAGVRPDFVRTYVSEDMPPLPPDTEAYWALFLKWLGGRVFPYLDAEDQERYRDLCDPFSPNYLLSRANAYCVELTTVACGLAPQ
jgi:SAM-dependent methyltransferase